jgi:hypothetical protein
MAEVGAQQLGVGGMDPQPLDQPIGGRIPQEQAEGGTAGGKGFPQLAHEAIVDAQIGEGA